MNTPLNISHTFNLTPEQYMHDVVTKTQIVLHHTVGGSAQSTFEYWQSNTDRIGVAYILDRDGTIYEVFDPHYWAWHLGLTSPNNRIANQRSIGIEIASEGALRTGSELNAIRAQHGCPAPFDAGWLYAFDVDPDKARPPAKWFTRAKKLYMIGADIGKYYMCADPYAPYRGYMYFDAYDAPQLVSVVALVNSLCDDFHLPRALVGGDIFAFRPGFVNFTGVIHHAQVRADKSDLHPGFDFSIFNYTRIV